MARQVDLTGMVPVTVTVNLDTHKVTEVHVWDEEVRVDKPLPDDDVAWPEAIDIAEQVDWPEWKFGA
jgi:hypothetical protein